MQRRPRVFVMRHGHSTFQTTYEVTKVDPGIIDAGLSERGKEQVDVVADEASGLGVDVVVTSPLTRAIETALGPFAGTSTPIIVEALIRERLGDSCDIGRSASVLALEYPMLDFSHLPEIWWSMGEEDKRGVPIEPRTELADRVAAFKGWLSLREEESILIVSHSDFLRQLTGDEIRNCEIREWTDGTR